MPTMNKCGFSLLVYTIESWTGVSGPQKLLDLTEVIKGIFRVLRRFAEESDGQKLMLPGCAEEAMEALERKFIYFWESDVFGLPGRCAGRYQKQCVSK